MSPGDDKKDPFGLGCATGVVVTALVGVIAFILAYNEGYRRGQTEIQQQIVLRGEGEWYKDDRLDTKFRWRTPAPMVEAPK